MIKRQEHFAITIWFILITLVFLTWLFCGMTYAQRRTVQPQHWIPFIQQESEPATPVKKLGVIWMDPNGDFVAKDYDGYKTYFAGQNISIDNFYEWSIDGNIIYVDGSNRSIGFFTNTPSSSAYIQLSDKFVICKTFTSAGINACIDALGTEGGEVYLPEGTYACTATITIDYANTTLRGAGEGTILRIDANGFDGITINQKDGTLISNLKIDGNEGTIDAKSADSLIDINGASQFRAKIEECILTDYDVVAIDCSIDLTGGGIIINNCIFKDSETANSEAIRVQSYNSVIISNNIFSDIEHGIRYNSPDGTKLKIIGNYFYSCDDTAIEINATGALISGNGFYYNSGMDMDINDMYTVVTNNNSYANTSGDSVNLNGSGRCVFANNIYEGDTGTVGIEVTSNNNIISGNSWDDATVTSINWAIYLNGANNNTISSNTWDVDTYGIYISDSHNNLIFGNTGNMTSGTADVYVDSDSNANIIYGNYFPDGIVNNSADYGDFEIYGDTIIDGSLTIDMLDMEEITSPSTPPTNTLRLYTEAIKGFSFLKYYDDTGMKRQLIRDSMILVKNVRGTTIAANRIVYATGSSDNVPTVDAAKADSIDTMPAIGVTIEAIANNAYGRVMQVGLLENINTSTLAEGDILYVSDATAGVPVTTPPITPSLTQEIGTCLVSDPNTGAIQIIARGLTGDEYGTAQNIFYLGDGAAGTKTLTFNGVNDASIQWDSNNSNYAFVPDNAGTLKFWTYQADDIADEGTVNLPDATSGMIFACITDPDDVFADASGFWMVSHDGACTLVSGTAGTTAATDSDGDLCVYDGGTHGIIKNRMGNIGEIRAFYFYN